MLSLRRLLGAFFVAALLVAQQAALEHPLAHAADAHDGEMPLCDLHDALGTVAGAITGASPTLVQESPGAAVIAAVLPAARAGAPLAPSSRGPPTLL